MCLKEVAREKMKISFSSHGIKKISRKPRSNQERKIFFFFHFSDVEKELCEKCYCRLSLWQSITCIHTQIIYCIVIKHPSEMRREHHSNPFILVASKLIFHFHFPYENVSSMQQQSKNREKDKNDGFWDVVAIMSCSHFKIDISF